MPTPIIAIPADFREIEGNVWHASPHQYVRAALNGSGVMSLLVPALEAGNEPDAILDRVDGLLSAVPAPTSTRRSMDGRRWTQMARSIPVATPPACR